MGQPIERCCWLVLEQTDVGVTHLEGQEWLCVAGLGPDETCEKNTPSAKLMQLLGTRVMTVIVMNFDVEC